MMENEEEKKLVFCLLKEQLKLNENSKEISQTSFLVLEHTMSR